MAEPRRCHWGRRRERAMAVRFQGSVTVQEKGVGDCCVACVLWHGQGRGRKEAEIWGAGRSSWPFAPCSGVPRCRMWSRKPIGWTERERLNLAARKKAKYFRNLYFKVVSIFPKQHLFQNQSISGLCLFANTQKGSLKITSYFVFQQDGFFLALNSLCLDFVFVLATSHPIQPLSSKKPSHPLYVNTWRYFNIRLHPAVILWERKIWKPLCSIFFCSRRNIPVRLQFQAIIGWNQ